MPEVALLRPEMAVQAGHLPAEVRQWVPEARSEMAASVRQIAPARMKSLGLRLPLIAREARRHLSADRHRYQRVAARPAGRCYVPWQANFHHAEPGARSRVIEKASSGL